MKYFIIFVVFLLGCSDEHETLKKICNPFRMTISDAIPVQFWVNGVETFNQKEVCGINSVCFCQQFNSDDEITIQFEDSDNESRIINLIIYDSNSQVLATLEFNEVSQGIYQISFVPSEQGVTNEQIQLQIELFNADSISGFVSQTSAADNSWNDVVFCEGIYAAIGNGIFVAVSSSGVGNRIMTSDDGITWATQTSAANDNWVSVTCSNGIIVAVSISGTSMYSGDGVTWALGTGLPVNNWQSVTYGNGVFVAVSSSGSGNRAATSPDGINWTSRSTTDSDWYAVKFANGIFVAVGDGSGTDRVMTSSDGITWTPRSSSLAGGFRSITYGEGLFVVVGTSGAAMTSSDGINWTTRTLPYGSGTSWNSIAYGDGLFVAVGAGTGNERVAYSVDGITWVADVSPTPNTWNGVTYGEGIFVAVSSTGAGDRVMIAEIVNNDIVLANSDCIDINEAHQCTQLIHYTNSKDFAGIDYEVATPNLDFYIRIPAIFFHETNTEEEESFEESTENIVRLRNEIKVKRLLDIGFMPHYMHRKLNLILAHDTIEIDGENWIKRDPYEKDPGNKRYPLKKASVLLTQKDYIKRNIL